jgi:hypothetical protein
MRMYWKMSIDLSRPLVPSMGQHDPLDGLLTYAMLRRAAGGDAGPPVLEQEMADMAGMVRNMPLATSDPLGIGGLLFDSVRIARLTVQGGLVSPGLLESVTAAALDGLGAFVRTRSLELPAGYRLAFRELGLAIGLAGTEQILAGILENPHRSVNAAALRRQAGELQHFMPLKQTIEEFWLERENQASATWKEHREINTVMLATSLAPGGFLEFPAKNDDGLG